ncbi:hypothetical protein [Nocardiopsis sp. LDBS1602]|uniref:hypothetical protein n=1 Tax=Nocardiopsis sp. LDBS1602 TaxID=3109597 RepID=UPI002DBA4D8C|nr:hypothetical protein [Nocardiopsis sp. LDBS1602]MEC3891842.1 hypothetical protein [Nocardiopsis sp. LDBS1602]
MNTHTAQVQEVYERELRWRRRSVSAFFLTGFVAYCVQRFTPGLYESIVLHVGLFMFLSAVAALVFMERVKNARGLLETHSNWVGSNSGTVIQAENIGEVHLRAADEEEDDPDSRSR